jgi:ATP-dependent helicase/nuclease subunit B
MNSAASNLYTIPAGAGFSRALVYRLMKNRNHDPQSLTEIRILLPTRRACRTVRESFLRYQDGKPLLLPRLQPMGDVDEEELSLSLFGAGDQMPDIPPAISTAERQILLAQCIMKLPGHEHSFSKALSLAQSLGRFLDQIHIEELDFDALDNLVPLDFAAHWQITIEFFKILREVWPGILAARGQIDAADRRGRLMRALALHWEQSKPQTPILIAGSTGSIPATARLMKVIKSLPQGQIILPGLDCAMPQEDWDVLQPSHPQYGLKKLLEALDCERQNVQAWPLPETYQNDRAQPRFFLAREMMRPAETTAQWANLSVSALAKEKINTALENLEIIQTATQQDEAGIIALKFRETLEYPNKTAALITPDRKLAARVIAQCRRWGLEIDDSAGTPLDKTLAGQFLLQTAEAALSNIAPVAFLSCLKHPFSQVRFQDLNDQAAIENLEKNIFRGLKPAAGFSGLKAKIDTHKKNNKSVDFLSFINILEEIFTPLQNLLSSEGTIDFQSTFHTHIALCEALSTSVQSQNSPLWDHEAGSALSQILSSLLESGDIFPKLSTRDYIDTLQHFMKTIAVRPVYGTHPRLSILGQLEARLIDADIVILGGLNEGTWPPDPDHDPWMSRPMREKFGLPPTDRAIGLAAHDFIQGFCASDVLITRSEMVEKSPTVAARWLGRLQTVLEAASLASALKTGCALKHYLAVLDQGAVLKTCERPKPCPPLASRPLALSVTQIESWMKDPYGIYARHILKLKPLKPLEKPIDHADTGDLVHKVLERFGKTYPHQIPHNAKDILEAYILEEIKTISDDIRIWNFWLKKFSSLCDWFIENEILWRQSARILLLEGKGTWAIPVQDQFFTLTGKADRIDLIHADGSCAVIDYKTGGTYAAKKMMNGQLPQLPLEALLIENGGFSSSGLPSKPVSQIAYWVLKGGHEGGKIITLDGDGKNSITDAIANTRNGLIELIEAFLQPETPYICLPDAANMPRFNDYEHLSRFKEWGVAADAEPDFESDAA